MSTHRTPPTEAPRSLRERDSRSEREQRFERTDSPASVQPTRARRRPANEPGSSRLRGWRGDVAAASGLNVLAGIWLIIAPFVLGYGSGDPYWNDIVFGAIIAVLALVRISGAYRASELSWINALIGVWLFVSAFWLDSTGRAGGNDIILGIVVFLLAIASASATEDAAIVEEGRGGPTF
jgi:hypothetical protein